MSLGHGFLDWRLSELGLGGFDELQWEPLFSAKTFYLNTCVEWLLL